jgi:hypothetical protein
MDLRDLLDGEAMFAELRELTESAGMRGRERKAIEERLCSDA